MKAGIVGVISGESDEIDSFHRTSKKDGTKFTRSLQITKEGHTKSGNPIYLGEAAIQEVEEMISVSIEEDSGEIIVTEEPRREGKYTEVMIVPSEFVVASSGSGEFAFDLVQELSPEISVNRAELELTEFAEEYYRSPGVNPWQVGFYGNIGEAEKGVVYGDEVFNDDEIGDVLERAQINQLGLQYQVNDKDIKMTSARSGYVEVYQPSNFSSEDYAEYILSEIIPIAAIEE